MVLRFRIQIKQVKKPPVWRRILVPDQFTLARFHDVIQAAFGWEQAHLFEFYEVGSRMRDPSYGVPDEYGDDDVTDAAKVKLSKVFHTAGQKFIYIYDFGDYWEHEVVLEAMVPGRAARATLLEGKGACPPEDCGGPGGYDALKQVMANPAHPEHAGLRQWLGLAAGERFDPDLFYLEERQELVADV